jgi:hypothetical protein
MDAPSGFDADEFDGDSAGSDNEGEPGSGAAAPGMGQSKSSRRRRRKRKGKVGGPEGAAPSPEVGQTAAPPAPIIMEGESLALAAGAAPPQRKHQTGGGQPQASGGGSSQPGGTGKRWKKKFRDRERRPARSENPGNEVRADTGGSNGFSAGNGYRQDYRPDNFGNTNGGFKRKGKGGGQPKERGFVGPMDHSYREGTGTSFDTPPSTIQIHGSHGGRRGGHRHQGDNQPIDHSMPRPIPIPEGAQTHIYFFIEELFFIAKIQETARKQGVKVAFLKNEKEAVAELTTSEENKPALIVFDLNNANAKPLTLIPKLKAKLKRSVSIVGFLSHLQGDLKAKAVEAGCDVVMPRAAFSQNLPNLLRRYGVEEDNEINFNR